MIIYLIENLINHKIYIGQSIRSIEERFRSHICDVRRLDSKRFSYLHNAMHNEGIDNFEIRQLDNANTMEELNKLEKWWIEIFQSNNREIGYNIESGGKGRGKVSEETKRKISIGNTGQKRTQETKLKMSNFQKGKTVSEETNKKISEYRISNKLAIGENNPNTNLTWQIVNNIRLEFIQGIKRKDISIKYNINYNTLCDIIRNRTWRI